MNYQYLEQISRPEDLKRLQDADLPLLCSEIRDFLIQSVAKTGGHLASNLGAVELSVGMHRVFSAPEDCLMLDVGHQSYVHKLLTGRREAFHTLRTYGGISGFLRPAESEYDCFVSGHASNSISAALGMARAKQMTNQPGSVVCMIGDGALTGGMAYEALNDAGESGTPLIVIFNDNEMSIGKSVGAVAKRLADIRLRPGYFRLKGETKRILSALPGGESLIHGASHIKSWLKNALLKETLFEILGFTYLGPADGNNISSVCMLLEQAKKLNEPVVVHFKTVKGKGYPPAEENPDVFHGVSPFDPSTGLPLKHKHADFSAMFGKALCDLAEKNDRVCAVTAAMSAGTGLTEFADRYPHRFFDVGIAEEHAITMASGMASQGAVPVCAIYSTFLQRGYDQLLHDVAIAGNHVVFGVDRAGIVGADGATHQGIFDVPYLMTVPGMQLLSPSSFAELGTALRYAIEDCTGPVAVRYPRGGEGNYHADTMQEAFAVLQPTAPVVVISYGILINHVLEAAEQLEKDGVAVGVVKVNELTAFEGPLVTEALADATHLIVLEDCVEHGCLGQQIAAQYGKDRDVVLLNLKDQFIPEGEVAQLEHSYQIDTEAVVAAVKHAYAGS